MICVDYEVSLYCDNQSTICLAEGPVFHVRTKHVGIHILSERVLQEIEMWLIRTDNQVANLSTKGLSASKFEKFRRQLSMMKRMRWC